jgi:ABC-type glycerol-3-phosphate transport system permease component
MKATLLLLAVLSAMLCGGCSRQDDSSRTIRVARNIGGRKGFAKHWDTIFAGVVVLSLPVTVLYLTMQRRLVAGLTGGAVK